MPTLTLRLDSLVVESIQNVAHYLAGRLVEILPHKSVFYASVAPLVAFYAFFASVLYPASIYLHPHGFSAHLAPMVPIGLHGLLKVLPLLPALPLTFLLSHNSQASV